MQEQLIKQERLEKKSKGHNLETKNVGTINLICICRPNLKHIPIKLHEETPTITELWCKQEYMEKKLK